MIISTKFKYALYGLLAFLVINIFAGLFYISLYDAELLNKRLFLEEETNLIELEIVERTNLYATALRSGVGLIEASDYVSRDEWETFVSTIDLQTSFPGIQGFGYAEFIELDELLEYETAIQEEGFTDFKIYPVGTRALYSSITYIEPFDRRNQEALGYDMYTNEIRREAMDMAIETGEPQLTGRVTLVQEIDEDVQPGFLIYLPVFEKGAPIRNNVERESAIIGFVYSPFRANDFMEGALHDHIDVDYAIFDGEAINADNLLYDSRADRDQSMYSTYTEDTAVIRRINLQNHNWTLLVTPKESDYFSPFTFASIITFPRGLVLGIIFGLAIYFMGIYRFRAEELAEQMTRDYRKANAELNQKVDEISKMNKLMINRELKMIDLKKEIKELKSDRKT